MRNLLLVVAALALLPSIAHAEFATPRNTGDVRPALATKRTKTEIAKLDTPKLETTKLENAPTRVAMAPVVVAQRLSVDEVLGRINTVYMAGVQRCYRKSLEIDPSLSGKVMLAFHVDGEGHVQSQLAMTTKFEECMTRMMTTWKFSAPAGEADSTFRISLVLTNY